MTDINELKKNLISYVNEITERCDSLAFDNARLSDTYAKMSVLYSGVYPARMVVTQTNDSIDLYKVVFEFFGKSRKVAKYMTKNELYSIIGEVGNGGITLNPILAAEGVTNFASFEELSLVKLSIKVAIGGDVMHEPQIKEIKVSGTWGRGDFYTVEV